MNSEYQATPLGAQHFVQAPQRCRSCGQELKLVEQTVTHDRRRGRRAGRAASKVMVWAHVAQPQRKTKARRS